MEAQARINEQYKKMNIVKNYLYSCLKFGSYSLDGYLEISGFNTSPATIIAVFVILASFTFCAIFFKVPLIISGHPKLLLQLLWVYPHYIRRQFINNFINHTNSQKIHIVAWCLDKLEMLSRLGSPAFGTCNNNCL